MEIGNPFVTDTSNISQRCGLWSKYGDFIEEKQAGDYRAKSTTLKFMLYYPVRNIRRPSKIQQYLMYGFAIQHFKITAIMDDRIYSLRNCMISIPPFINGRSGGCRITPSFP